MRVLVCSALRDRGGQDEAIRAVRARAKPGVEVIGSLNGIDWESVRALEGGWDAAYEWATRNYDGFCVVPIVGHADALSRGVYQIAEAALRLGKPVIGYSVARGGLFKIARVWTDDVGGRNWRDDYGHFAAIDGAVSERISAIGGALP